jgi:transcriptional regulator with XRE-family HTH domain
MENLAILIGKRIREVRLSKGIRQEDMERLGISYKYFVQVSPLAPNTAGVFYRLAVRAR